MESSGRVKKSYFELSSGPLPDEAGSAAGLVVACGEALEIVVVAIAYIEYIRFRI